MLFHSKSIDDDHTPHTLHTHISSRYRTSNKKTGFELYCSVQHIRTHTDVASSFQYCNIDKGLLLSFYCIF